MIPIRLVFSTLRSKYCWEASHKNNSFHLNFYFPVLQFMIYILINSTIFFLFVPSTNWLFYLMTNMPPNFRISSSTLWSNKPISRRTYGNVKLRRLKHSRQTNKEPTKWTTTEIINSLPRFASQPCVGRIWIWCDEKRHSEWLIDA